MPAREWRGGARPGSACRLLPCAGRGSRATSQGGAATSVAETIGWRTTEPASRFELADYIRGRRKGLAFLWSTVVVLANAGLLERGTALAENCACTTGGWRTNGIASQSVECSRRIGWRSD